MKQVLNFGSWVAMLNVMVETRTGVQLHKPYDSSIREMYDSNLGVMEAHEKLRKESGL